VTETQPLRIIFAGTPDFAASTLRAILNSHHHVIACYTQPDRPAGRGRKLAASPVKVLAEQHQIPVYQPLNFKEQADIDALNTLNADLMVVVAYGLILPKVILEAPRLGCINVHASLLPRWRGAAPIQRAIAAGDHESGVTIMQMDIGLDTGDMLKKVITPITPEDSGGSLHDRLAELGASACVSSLDDISNNALKPEPQDNALANYAHKLSKQEGQIDWSLDTHHIHNTIRAFNPWPVAHTLVDDQKVRVFDCQPVNQQTNEQPGTIIDANKTGITVATADGVLRITQMQLSGSKKLPVSDILNSRKALFAPGKQFSS